MGEFEGSPCDIGRDRRSAEIEENVLLGLPFGRQKVRGKPEFQPREISIQAPCRQDNEFPVPLSRTPECLDHADIMGDPFSGASVTPVCR